MKRLLFFLVILSLFLIACSQKLADLTPKYEVYKMGEYRYMSEASSKSYDFGSVPIGSCRKVTFTIKNSGDAELILGTLPYLSGNNNSFSLKNNFNRTSVLPDDEVSITISFIPTQSGNQSTKLMFKTNAPDYGDFSLELMGKGIENKFTSGEIEVSYQGKVLTSGQELYLGDFDLFVPSKNIDFKIKNIASKREALYLTGSKPVIVNGLNSGEIGVSKEPDNSLIPGSWYTLETTFSLRVVPVINSLKSVQLIIPNSSSNEPDFVLNLKFGGVWSTKIVSDRRDFITDCVIDSFGNIYVAGYAINLVNSFSKEDWWIKKIGPDGVEDTINWDKKIDGNGRNDRLYTLLVDKDDNLYAAGYGTNLVSASSSKDWWIKKFNSNGVEDSINWNKSFSGSKTNYIDIEYISSLALDSKGNIYVAGQAGNLVDLNSAQDWWIKKFNSDGIEDTISWDKKINGRTRYYSSEKGDTISKIVVDSFDNLYVLGNGLNVVGENSSYDSWFKKFDSDGVEDLIQWDRKYDVYNNIKSAIIDVEDNLYVLLEEPVATRYSLKKFNKEGVDIVSEWESNLKSFDGTIIAFQDMAIDNLGYIYIAGHGKGGNYYMNNDWHIKRYNLLGEEDLSYRDRIVFGDKHEYLYSLICDMWGNLYAVGESYNGYDNNELYIRRYEQ